MEREKMIEEMARDYDDIKTKSYKDYIPQSNMGIAYYFANALADKSYRKIPDGAVVLTREEYDKLGYNSIDEEEYIRVCDLYKQAVLDKREIKKQVEENAYKWECLVREAKEQARKELLQDIKEHMKKYVFEEDDLQKLAEKYGVEVEE